MKVRVLFTRECEVHMRPPHWPDARGRDYEAEEMGVGIGGKSTCCSVRLVAFSDRYKDTRRIVPECAKCGLVQGRRGL